MSPLNIKPLKKKEKTSGVKKASAFEVVAARLWNVLNEGKTFTPVFVLCVLLLYTVGCWDSATFWLVFLAALCLAWPAFVLMYIYDFPLHLRWWIWPLWLSLFLWLPMPPWPLYGWATGVYIFFTVFFWGTLYYHLRMGTPWTNFTRFWILVLKNSDTTSGNAQEQIPKVLLLTTLMYGLIIRLGGTDGAMSGGWMEGGWLLDETGRMAGGSSAYALLLSGGAANQVLQSDVLTNWMMPIRTLADSLGNFPWPAYVVWMAGAALVSVLVHRLLFNWKPEEYEVLTQSLPQPAAQGGARPLADIVAEEQGGAVFMPVAIPDRERAVFVDMTEPPRAAQQPWGEPVQVKTSGQAKRRVYMVVIDGCRKDRLEEAQTPFIDWLQANGTTYEQMETIYPARTVVCFSSMFTGAYPRQHGIKSNMVWQPGVRCESIFDSLRKVGKRGRLLGVAHLLDAFGEDVDSYTAVMHNDEVDGRIMAAAEEIVETQDPDLLIVQLISTDQTGHSRGALNEEYREKIEEADRHIAAFYRWLSEQGKMQDGIFIVCADHGQSDGIGGHGHLDKGERFVPFVMYGEGIKRGHVVRERRSLVSVAPTLACLLEAPVPGASRGPILTEALEGL